MTKNIGGGASPLYARLRRIGSDGKPGPDKFSNDAFATLATVRDDTFRNPGQLTQTYEYEVYSPEPTQFDVQVYRIACPKTQASVSGTQPTQLQPAQGTPQ